MQVSRYVNGQTVTREELSALSLAPPALIRAVWDAKKRAEGASWQGEGMGEASSGVEDRTSSHGVIDG